MKNNAKKYAAMFNPNGLKLPKSLPKRGMLCASKRIVLPTSFIIEGGLTKVEDQGSYPYCAAYASSTFGESVLWKRNGYPIEIDPVKIYKHAKTIDGDPTGDGTFLECALDGLLGFGYFSREVCKVKTMGGAWYGYDPKEAIALAKMALFRYGSCVVGFKIDSSWYEPKNGVVVGGGAPQGGHAVTLCGFDGDGLIIRNSWGAGYGHNGDIYIPNAVAEKQFMYGATLTNALNGLEA